MKTLITGITGQDGSFLAELLLEKGHEVFGMVRRRSTQTCTRIQHLVDKIKLVEGDLSDLYSLISVVKEVQPDEVYNLASQSFVPLSWKQPELTSDVTGLGVARMLMALREIKADTKFYQASSSEMFGKVQETPQTEQTVFYPRSPYGCAKLFGHWMTVNYRESYGMFCCSGILFNHESHRRGSEFVTKKITSGVARIVHDKQECLHLGNLDAKRDWGFAGDFVNAMYLMLQQTVPDDYVIATGSTHSVREFVTAAFQATGNQIRWEGSGEKECGYLGNRCVVAVNPEFYRPAEVDLLLGDASKARRDFGWAPKVSFEKLVEDMVKYDLNLL